MSLLEFIANRLPRFSKNDCALAWEEGRAFERQTHGLTRDKFGRFKSVAMPRKTALAPAQPLAARPTLGACFHGPEIAPHGGWREL